MFCAKTIYSQFAVTNRDLNHVFTPRLLSYSQLVWVFALVSRTSSELLRGPEAQQKHK